MNNTSTGILDMTMGKLATNRLSLFSSVMYNIFIQQNDVLRNIQPITNTTHYYYGRYFVRIVKTIYSIEQRRNRLIHNEGTHPTIPCHKICCAVDEELRCAIMVSVMNRASIIIIANDLSIQKLGRKSTV
jgi:hypothetical protein